MIGEERVVYDELVGEHKDLAFCSARSGQVRSGKVRCDRSHRIDGLVPARRTEQAWSRLFAGRDILLGVMIPVSYVRRITVLGQTCRNRK